MQRSVLSLLLTHALAAWAATPDGFAPASTTELFVAYADQPALDGVNLPRASTAQEPTIGTAQQLPGKSYTVIMVDIDVPGGAGTFLHWAQTDLTPSATNTTVAGRSVHTLAVGGAGAAAPIASYRQPSPPARNPTTHRYVEVLVDTSDITADGTAALQALSNRQGAQVNDVLTQAGLANKVVAGNFFTVTNGQ